MLGIVSIILFIFIPKIWVRIVCGLVWLAGLFIFPDQMPYHIIGSAFIAGISLLIKWLINRRKERSE